VTRPRCGWLHRARIPGAAASHLAILTEDVWNDAMRDAVVVPVYPRAHPRDTLLTVALGDDLEADCTRVQSMPHEFVGEPIAPLDGQPWVRLRVNVRRFLDVDARAGRQPARHVRPTHAAWWPRQNDVHFASNPRIGPQSKLYAPVSSDAWNSAAGASYCPCVRLTSKTKQRRLRWEVPVSGGCVVTGDLYAVAFHRFEQAPPPAKYPARLTADESAQIAGRQKRALSLA
jgi:mRNA-degrading endonuclease toxin of MazEF toxin-antitoxin module